MNYFDDDADDESLWMSTEWPNFQPHLILGWSESEWHRFCSFYDTMSIFTEQSVMKIIEAADAILESTIDYHIIDAFERFINLRSMSIAEGLTHPDAWIRNLTRICVIRRQNNGLSFKV